MPLDIATLESAWRVLNIPEWIDVLQTATGRFLRFDMAAGKLYSWNRSTIAWDDVTSQYATIVSAGALSPIVPHYS